MVSSSPGTPSSQYYKSAGAKGASTSPYTDPSPCLKLSMSSSFGGSNYEYQQGQRTYPFTAQEPTPQMILRGSRMRHIGKKLAFWKKRPTTTSDVYNAFHRVANSHDDYRNDLKNACSVLREWTEYLSPPSLLSEDLLQHQLMDVNLSQWLGSLLDTINPVVDSERKFNEVYTALAHSFESLKKEEAMCKSAIFKQNQAERRFFKAMANNSSEQETNNLNQERARLVGEVDNATERFHRTCWRELPLRFCQIKSFYEQISKETSRASKSVERLIFLQENPRTPPRTPPSSDSKGASNPYNDPVSFGMPSFSVGPLQTPKYPGMSSYMSGVEVAKVKEQLQDTPMPTPEPAQPVQPPMDDANSAPFAQLGLDLSGVGPESLVWT